MNEQTINTAFNITYSGFGMATESTPGQYKTYYQTLGYNGYANGVVLAFNYPGLGLP
jgi:hypothetical protein